MGVCNGDIICRKCTHGGLRILGCWHFGIYASGWVSSSVIHYFGESGSDAEIKETDFNTFMDGESQYLILRISGSSWLNKKVERIPGHAFAAGLFQDLSDNDWKVQSMKDLFQDKMTIYSPAETFTRARSRIGEKQWSGPWNNCEHFAMWCKTGLSRSDQVEALYKKLMEVALEAA